MIDQYIQDISNIQKQLTESRDEVRILNLHSQQRSHESASDDVVIWNFWRKSKDGAVNMIEKVIEDKDGNPKNLMDKVGLVPQEIPIKFDFKNFT